MLLSQGTQSEHWLHLLNVSCLTLQIPVACKSCPCGYVFISRKLLNAKLNERSSPAIADKLDFKRRRTERIRRERIDSSLTNDMENRRRPRTNSQSDPIRRGRGRPKTVGLKKPDEDKGEEVVLHTLLLQVNCDHP
ncbi:UPF0547 protein C16orf87 homolog [Notothenia coriiceps]|uniref:UPF0547 protein C16orf87 homolog n=1 Tax=Notothenia coriiceps TaxID=8208 RepID=A0A6I9NQV3_9TELE|nr:PREDICTED: UPF0547 protein C16orf87 homolog [Notothenia coriiceps]